MTTPPGAEEQAKHDHGEEGLDDGPGSAQDGLLVADGNVAPGQEKEQIAILPEIGELE
jgi:hypothetical protein